MTLSVRGIRELAPGVRAFETPPPFAISRHHAHNEALVEGTPVVVRSDAPPWSYLASFPAGEGAFVAPPGAIGFGWLTRVTCELMAGSAALSYGTLEPSRLCGETMARPGARHLDLLTRDPAGVASVMVRRGAEPGPTELRIHRFDCFYLLEDDASSLSLPPGVAIGLRPRWSRFYGEQHDDLLERVRALHFGSFRVPRPMQWLEGLEVTLAPQEQISRALYVSGLYEPCTATVLRQVLNEGDTFIDIGANIGLFTMLGSRWVGPAGHVLAVEPSRRELTRLEDHVRLNGLGNVEIARTAVGDRDGEATLHVAGAERSGLNTIEDRFLYGDVEEAYVETVPIARLDTVLSRRGITRVNVIKIDVEGSEHQVLEGARATLETDRPLVILELAEGMAPVHRAARASIAELLRRLDYRFLAIDGHAGVLRPVATLDEPAENVVAGTRDAIAALLP